MRCLCLLVSMGLAIFGVPGSAKAQDSIKVGVLTELSGPLGTLGMAERDGFSLYVKKAGGKLGGLTVETVVEDTGNDPATALVKARKLFDSDKIDVLLGRRGAAEKVAGFILSWARRCEAEGVVHLAMSRQDMADYLGLTIESVSRSLSQFERDGVIALPSTRQLKVLDAGALEDLAA